MYWYKEKTQLILKQKIAQHQYAQGYTVDPEKLEIMLSDIVHKKSYGNNWNNKGCHHSEK